MTFDKPKVFYCVKLVNANNGEWYLLPYREEKLARQAGRSLQGARGAYDHEEILLKYFAESVRSVGREVEVPYHVKPHEIQASEMYRDGSIFVILQSVLGFAF